MITNRDLECYSTVMGYLLWWITEKIQCLMVLMVEIQTSSEKESLLDKHELCVISGDLQLAASFAYFTTLLLDSMPVYTKEKQITQCTQV